MYKRAMNIIQSSFIICFFAFSMSSCSSDQPSIEADDTEAEVLENKDTVLTFSCALDGPDDEWFYVDFPDSLNLEGIKEIHLVPQCFSPEDSSLVAEYMLAISQSDFEFYPVEFDSYSGRVHVYYNASKEVFLTEYNLVNGLVNGMLELYNPKSEKIVSREYENGVCVRATLDLYASDWTFNPKNSSLDIKDLSQYQTLESSGETAIWLGPSIHSSADGSGNDQYDLIRKDVFENDFYVNGSPYTGCIFGLFQYTSFKPQTYFELHFVEGKLNDTIRVYGGWGLELEEVYSQGELVEVIYQAEEMDGMAKPVIYLYPEKEMAVHVKLDLKGKITHSYPKYPEDGWNVWAKEDGTLYDLNGKEYYALFWEGVSSREFTYSEGFVVKGDETEVFLENSLELLGLTRREANEFIMYWLPQMENNFYNLIHFSTEEYEEIAKLKITPKPESILRIMMVWSPLDQPIAIPQQNLYDLKVERKGFTVVEWGGKKQACERELN